jgi:hypothetical protein
VDEDKVNHLNLLMLQKDDNNRYGSRLKNDYKEVVHLIAIQKEQLIREIKEFILEFKVFVKN